MKKIFISAIALSLSLSFANAQEKWDLKKCIDYAKEHNINLQLRKLDTKTQSNYELQSKLDLAPSLSGSSNYNFSYGRSTRADGTLANVNTQSGNIGLSSSVTLFNGFQKINTIKKSQIDLKAALLDVEKAQSDLKINVATYYLNVLLQKELVKVAKEKIKVTKTQIERTKVLVEAGTLAKGTLLEQKAQLAQEEVNLINAENRTEIALLDLAQLLDLKEKGNFDIVLPELPILNATRSMSKPSDVYVNSLTFRPEIKAAEYRVESSEKNLAINKGGLLPSLTMSGSYGSSYSKDFAEMDLLRDQNGNPILVKNKPQSIIIRQEMKLFDQLKNRKAKSFGFRLSIPIFNGFSSSTRVKNAKVNLAKTKFQLELKKNTLRKEIEQAYTNAKAAMKKYFASEAAVESAQEAFRYTEEKYNLGLVNSVDYDQKKNDLFRTKSELLQAKYEYIVRAKILDYYNGVEITL